jgi:hypothetical protein
MFSRKSTHKVAGEITPSYLYWQNSMARIWEYNPQIKLIVILRNPILRSYSQWTYNHKLDFEDLDFLEAVNNEESRCRKKLPKQHRKFSYIQRSNYCEQIKRMWRFFPRDQVKIFKFDDLINNHQSTLDDLSTFLKISNFPSLKQEHKNISGKKRQIKKDEYIRMRNLFYFEIKELERILNWNCSSWLDLPKNLKD